MKQKQLQWNIGLRRIAELINSYIGVFPLRENPLFFY
ncbi:hypothetical protein Sta7437_0081 [Stanieria cyanosphaera PCC 7437]|uniref:Uncharacterized protein n=1 Tax=Stanieria cyanosphaera (strain ATCC 29371 / PCC 7437) TaxID=111780 RepID=K9XPU8_STAC7|nr:hypothetical protein Sta7437_0081 [Stanieria cyanosphaera PCC 7437]